MQFLKRSLLFVLILLIIAGCNNGEEGKGKIVDSTNKNQEELFVSAAASLTEAMDEITELYEANHDVKLTFNFAGSGKLAQQIQQGAPVDVFISANENWMDSLEDEGLIDTDTRKDIIGNKLVLIVAKDSEMDIDSFNEIDKAELDQIAIGNPESVPAGEYTETILKNIHKWDELEEKFVYAQDVRQVLTYVETGNTDIGFVYESDALSSDQVKILAEADPSMHDPIIYPGAVTSDSTRKEEGYAFLEFLLSESGQKTLNKYGFSK
ncbi:molybdate ABC transporter substrate-binding protein [Pseudogracilibacillus sp. SE30717A]|uniref:molybdate ABC transporter substrate-binding protein n=1 Tax=Pseudogracilibacillus sp. SE30717A TaxID=3098293 RepID=UPI00300E39C0